MESVKHDSMNFPVICSNSKAADIKVQYFEVRYDRNTGIITGWSQIHQKKSAVFLLTLTDYPVFVSLK